MTNPIQKILDEIEAARRDGHLNNDAARAASVALGLEGHDAMLANRVLAQGSDPASLEYLTTGAVSPHVDLAHRNGPGALDGEERQLWLVLAAVSADESKSSTLVERVRQMGEAVHTLLHEDTAVLAQMAVDKREEIECEPFRIAEVGGRKMRLYESDLGFAAAYWSGEPCAAVLGTDHAGRSYVAVGSNGTPLEELGVGVEKPLAPCFGIIETYGMVTTDGLLRVIVGTES